MKQKLKRYNPDEKVVILRRHLLEQVREWLHVKDSDGQLNVGADAFTRLGSQTRGQRWLAKLLRLPVLKQLTHLAYNVFARLLYRWNRAKGHW